MVDTLIRLFPADAETFTTLGLGAIPDAISCDVQEVVNGSYELRMVYPEDGIRIDDIALKNIIYCKPQPHKNPQPFDIYKIVKGIGGTIEVYAEHSSYRLSRISVDPFSAASLALALQGLKSHAVGDCPFTFTTDKTVASPYTQIVPASIRQRLGGEEGSILDLYGGEYEWDNFTVKLWNHRGTNRGVTIRYGKNLTDLTQEQNIAGTYTGVYPFWRGTVDEQDVVVTLPEKVVYSDNASQYPYQMTVPLDLSMEFETQPTVAQLRSRAQTFITANNIGVPKVSLKVSFIDLQKTLDYADIAPLEQVDLGDTVTVQFEKLGVDSVAEVVSTDYNVLTDSYNSVEIGNVRASLSTTIVQQEEAVKKIETANKTFFEQAIDAATKLITGGLGGNIVFHFNDTTGYPDEMIIMDTDNVSTAVNCIRLNKNGIGFSQNGYNGPFNSAWTIGGTFDAGQINVINLNATSMTAGTLKSSNYDSSGGTAGFLLDLVTGNIYAPSLTISAVAEANAYTDGQVSGAISTAAADATSKANAAQSAAQTAAKNYTDTQISVIPGQIQSAISEIRFGGRNILKNSATKLFGLWSTAAANGGTMTTTDNVTVAAWGCTDAKRMTGKGGTTATVFAIMGGIYAPSSYSISGQAYTFSVFIKNDSAARILIVANGLGGSEYVSAGETKRVVINTAVGNGTSAVQFNVCTNTSGANYDITYWHPQIEYGNTATDWSPAPEDTQVGGTNLLKDSESMASWYKGSACTVSEGVATLAGTSSAWTALLSTSKYDASLYDGTTEYICSFEYKSTAASDTPFVICATAASVSSTSYTRTKYTTWFPPVSLPSTGGKWVKYTLPARTISQAQLTDGSGDVVSGYLSMYARTDNVSIQVRLFKLEKGNRATDWSPAPDDIENDYNSKFNVVEQNLSTLTQTTSGISTEVSKKVNITTYNANNQAVSQQISNLSSRIDQTAGSIKGIVTQEISGLNAQSQSISNWFDFSVSNFLTIGQQGSAYKTQITNSAFNILHGNTTIGSFSATGLNTPSLTLETTFNLPPFVLQSISGGWILTEAS